MFVQDGNINKVSLTLVFCDIAEKSLRKPLRKVCIYTKKKHSYIKKKKNHNHPGNKAGIIGK